MLGGYGYDRRQAERSRVYCFLAADDGFLSLAVWFWISWSSRSGCVPSPVIDPDSVSHTEWNLPTFAYGLQTMWSCSSIAGPRRSRPVAWCRLFMGWRSTLDVMRAWHRRLTRRGTRSMPTIIVGTARRRKQPKIWVFLPSGMDGKKLSTISGR